MTKDIVIKYLKNKGIFDKVDTSMIDELIFNQKQLNTIRARIEKEDFQYLHHNTKTGTVTKNPLLAEYHAFLTNLMKVSTKLALNSQDRLKLKIGEGSKEDDFE